MFFVSPSSLHVAPLGLGRFELRLRLVQINRRHEPVFQLSGDNPHLIRIGGHRVFKDLLLSVKCPQRVVITGDIGCDRESHDRKVIGGCRGLRFRSLDGSPHPAPNVDLIRQIKGNLPVIEGGRLVRRLSPRSSSRARELQTSRDRRWYAAR